MAYKILRFLDMYWVCEDFVFFIIKFCNILSICMAIKHLNFYIYFQLNHKIKNYIRFFVNQFVANEEKNNVHFYLLFAL